MKEIEEIQEKIKKMIEEKEQETTETETEEEKEYSKNELYEFAEIINFPYRLLGQLDEVFYLDEQTEQINQKLAYFVMIYYFPSLDLGKLSLFLLILLNISILAIKTIQYIKKKKEIKTEKIEEREQKKEQVKKRKKKK